MLTQQPIPKLKGFVLVLTNLTISVLSPTAAIAKTIKNLLSHFNGANTSTLTPKLTASVVNLEKYF